MLNENKVKMMTKMAIYEKNEGKRMLKMSRYYKGDFVTLGVLKSITFNICICSYSHFLHYVIWKKLSLKSTQWIIH